MKVQCRNLLKAQSLIRKYSIESQNMETFFIANWMQSSWYQNWQYMTAKNGFYTSISCTWFVYRCILFEEIQFQLIVFCVHFTILFFLLFTSVRSLIGGNDIKWNEFRAIPFNSACYFVTKKDLLNIQSLHLYRKMPYIAQDIIVNCSFANNAMNVLGLIPDH